MHLASLADVIRMLSDAATGVADRWMIVGAAARDLILTEVHGIPERRKTADLDVAIAVASWNELETMEANLAAAGAARNPRVAHEFFIGDWTVDTIPFSGVEKDGVIRWPADEAIAMNVLGFEEAYDHALEVLLPDDVRVRVVAPAGLLILKLIAWADRHWESPRRRRRHSHVDRVLQHDP